LAGVCLHERKKKVVRGFFKGIVHQKKKAKNFHHLPTLMFQMTFFHGTGKVNF